MPLAARVLLVLVHLRTNLTTRALAALLNTSQSAVDRIIHHLVLVLARALRPGADGPDEPWIIDGTLIPVHDHTISAVSKNYRRSVNTQIIICAHARRVMAVGRCWPGNRNDVVVARHTVEAYSPAITRSSVTAATTASKRSPHPGATTPAGSSAMTTTAHTAGSRPASSTSSPGSKTGKYYANVADTARP